MNNTIRLSARVNNQEYTALPTDLYIDPEYLQIFLEKFEGPLDLLLYLIRKQNLDILAIPIAKITDQYLHYINEMQSLNFDLAGEYLLMAALLLSIKSRMLLPKPILPEDSEENNDPRAELINRLLEYEKIKQAAKNLDELPLAGRDFLWLDIDSAPENKILPKIVMTDLVKALHNLLLKSQKAAMHNIQREELSVREYMTNILRTLAIGQQINFISLLGKNSSVPYIVVNFIAVLELAKEGLIGIVTANNDIIINLIS
ncbi:MAG: segregation/condensation protein A [Burkholderiales bacterium]|nr:segregation/condensation protein A [Burkholderiales bacterium]